MSITSKAITTFKVITSPIWLPYKMVTWTIMAIAYIMYGIYLTIKFTYRNWFWMTPIAVALVFYYLPVIALLLAPIIALFGAYQLVTLIRMYIK